VLLMASAMLVAGHASVVAFPAAGGDQWQRPGQRQDQRQDQRGRDDDRRSVGRYDLALNNGFEDGYEAGRREGVRMSGFYTEDGNRWVMFGPWRTPRTVDQDQLRSDWIHAANAAGTPWHEMTHDGTYTLSIKITPALEAQPLFTTDTKPAQPVEA